MKGCFVASALLVCLIFQVTSQCDDYDDPVKTSITDEERAPYDVMAYTNESSCDSGISETPMSAFVSWDPPRVVTSPIEAYVIHVVSSRGIDIRVRVAPNVTQHVLDFMECWNAYILRVEAQFESGESSSSRAMLYATGDRARKFFPQDLRAVEDFKNCENGGMYGSVHLRWKPAHLGKLNVTGYTVAIDSDKGTTNFFRLADDARAFKYAHVNCKGTTVIGVSARTRVNLGLFDYNPSEISFPAAYVAVSADTKPYILPAEGATTTASTTTESKSMVTEKPSYPTAEQSTTKLATTTEDSFTTLVASTEHSTTTTEHHYSSTISNDVEPVSTGVSTSTILCAVLIPLAVIILVGLLFFGYKKYKQTGGEGLLSASDSP
ncbi:uncharacterized protein LOC125940175 [Dermacentor silvarum]|uniref:uncharacterized protein LOC125940175 n=1 Tax=Dermacentor silvarum TaxID=543639 RepID=UPI0021009D4D|nr:uncharacterized protein LOC125940175 [Dermacentor silvarum]